MPGRDATLVESTNKDLKALDKKLEDFGKKATAAAANYKGATKDLDAAMKKLHSSHDAASFTKAADLLSDMLRKDDDGTLAGNQATQGEDDGSGPRITQKGFDLIAEAKALGNESADIRKRVMKDGDMSAAEADKFLEGEDVYKLKASMKPAEDLFQSTSDFSRKEHDLVKQLGREWKGNNSISLNTDAGAAADRLSTQLTGKSNDASTGAKDKSFSYQAHFAAQTYHDAFQFAGSMNSEDKARWSQMVKDNPAAEAFANNHETFQVDAPKGNENARLDILKALGEQEAAIDNLNNWTVAEKAMVDAKDMPNPPTEHNLGEYSTQVKGFLLDIKSDFEKVNEWTGELEDKKIAFQDASEGLSATLKKYGWTMADLKEADPQAYAKVQAANDNWVNNYFKKVDSLKGYEETVESKSKAWLDKWDQVKKIEAKQDQADLINAVIDIATGMAIGGNAIGQLASKDFIGSWNKDGNRGRYSAISNAFFLRTGQIGDMTQAVYTGSLKLNHLDKKNTRNLTLGDAVGQLENRDDKTGTYLSQLQTRLQTYLDEWAASRYEGLGAF
jgi:hypothetical protein